MHQLRSRAARVTGPVLAVTLPFIIPVLLLGGCARTASVPTPYFVVVTATFLPSPVASSTSAPIPTLELASTATSLPPASPTPTLQPTFTPLPTSTPVVTISPTPVARGEGLIVYSLPGNRLVARDLASSRTWNVAAGRTDYAWNADGTRLAMVNPVQSDGGGEIWTVNWDGTELRPITSGSNDRHPQWSPDGSRIAFERGDTVDPARATVVSGEVWVMDADGGSPIKLADGFDPAWSPEGKRMAYATNPEARDSSGPLRNSIGLMNAQGANKWTPVSTLTPGGPFTEMQWTMAQARLLDGPQWSPDGKEITFRALGGNSAYLSTDASKGGIKQFIALYFDDTPRKFSYSPDGGLITLGTGGLSGVSTLSVLQRGTAGPGGYDLSRAVATLGHVPRTGESPVNLDSFAWSPDGAFLLYALSGSAEHGVFILQLSTALATIIDADGQGPVFWVR